MAAPAHLASRDIVSPATIDNSPRSPPISCPPSSVSRRSSRQRLIHAMSFVTGAPPLSISSSQPPTGSPMTPSLTTSPTETSVQSSPEALLPRSTGPPSLSSAPLILPEALFTPPLPSGASAMSDAMQASMKASAGSTNTSGNNSSSGGAGSSTGGGGLVRRLSDRFVRRRTSANNVANRDQSSGPVILRRRSGHRGAVDAVSMLAEGLANCLDETAGLRPNMQDRRLSSASTVTPRPSPAPRTVQDGSEIPIIDDDLRRGSTLTKVTKRKRKQLLFVLDPQAAKVCWKSLSKKFYVDDIQSIRLQADARHYREELGVPEEVEDRWFTIIYVDSNRSKGRPQKTMHLIAPDARLFRLWTATLENLYRYRHALMTGLAGPGLDERSLQQHWTNEMGRKFPNQPRQIERERLDFASVERMCRSLHIICSPALLRSKFDRADRHRQGQLDYPAFRAFVQDLKQREDVRILFESLLTSSEPSLDRATFLAFLQRSQYVDTQARPAYWDKVFDRLASNSTSKDSILPGNATEEPRMDINAFTAFLSSPANDVLATSATPAVLDRPINDYFISSSHNTYLLGRQFAGVSSVEGYIRALQGGCRCIEIDCWDGPDGRPVVKHGRTMTTSVLFVDCVTTVASYAFEASPFPLILSLEVHCNDRQQQAMVEILIRELGSALVRTPIHPDLNLLPTPDELRHRILIKVKAPELTRNSAEPPTPTSPAAVDAQNTVVTRAGRRQRSISSPFDRTPSSARSSADSGLPLTSPSSFGSSDEVSHYRTTFNSSGGVTSASEDSDFTVTAPPRARTTPVKAIKSKIIPALRDLCPYLRGTKFHGLGDLATDSYNHIFSLSEPTIDNACRDPAVALALERHNHRHMMRVYPAGRRLLSSNFDPMPYWRRGVQMTALNYQTFDEGMQLNEAMFASSLDRSGYVLKPDELLYPTLFDRSASFGSSSSLSSTRTRMQFSVDLISAQFLECPRNGAGADSVPNPYIEIAVYVADERPSVSVISDEYQEAPGARDNRAAVTSPVRRRTPIVAGNGYSPVFGSRFRFAIETRHPHLVFVRWSVWNSPDGRHYQTDERQRPEATFTAKFSRLASGYRHLPLFNGNGEQFLFSTLFCHISKEDQSEVSSDEPDLVAPLTEKVGGRLRSLFSKSTSVSRKGSLDA